MFHNVTIINEVMILLLHICEKSFLNTYQIWKLVLKFYFSSREDPCKGKSLIQNPFI